MQNNVGQQKKNNSWFRAKIKKKKIFLRTIPLTQPSSAKKVRGDNVALG